MADGMGLGKTRQAIVAAEEDTEGMEGLKIVICPASLKINWRREIDMVLKTHVQVIGSGTPVEIKPKGWVVINYDMLPKYLDQILEYKERGLVLAGILDEAHYIKGKKTVRAKTALAVVKSLPRVYCLTGTPIMNRPVELYNLLVAVDHPLGRYGKKGFYLRRYCGLFRQTIFVRGQVRTFWNDSGATNLLELREVTKDVFLRRTKDEVLDLPEKIITVEVTELSKEWQREYDTAWDNYIAWVESHPEGKDIENILSAQSLVELTKLKQVCSRAKVSRIVSDVENAVEQENKVIIFSQFKDTVEEIRRGLSLKGIKSVRLTGEDNMEARQRAVDDFQHDPEVKAFVANIKAGGVGLNLTAASIVMFADMDWSPAVHEQAADRAHRIGQRGTVNVYYYVCEGTIEEDIVAILQKKLETIQAVIEGRVDYEAGTLGAEFLERIKARLNR